MDALADALIAALIAELIEPVGDTDGLEEVTFIDTLAELVGDEEAFLDGSTLIEAEAEAVAEAEAEAVAEVETDVDGVGVEVLDGGEDGATLIDGIIELDGEALGVLEAVCDGTADDADDTN